MSIGDRKRIAQTRNSYNSESGFYSVDGSGKKHLSIKSVILIVLEASFALVLLYYSFPTMLKTRSYPVLQKQEASIVPQQALSSGSNISPDRSTQASRLPASDSPDKTQPFARPLETAHPVGWLTISYYKKGPINIKYFVVEINGKPIEMMLDTGASYISFNTETIRMLGINSFVRKENMRTASGNADAYIFVLPSIKLGTIELKNVECTYLPTLGDNALGGTFLAHFNYSINETDQTITFVPKRGDVSLSEEHLPAAKQSVGWAEINGKKYILY
jgi:clan AA aspartic protease (TIGR02281 family)